MVGGDRRRIVVPELEVGPAKLVHAGQLLARLAEIRFAVETGNSFVELQRHARKAVVDPWARSRATVDSDCGGVMESCSVG